MLGIILHVVYRQPIFTPTFTLFLIPVNGAARNLSVSRMLTRGLYNTTWALSYFLGAIHGIPKLLKRRQHIYFHSK